MDQAEQGRQTMEEREKTTYDRVNRASFAKNSPTHMNAGNVEFVSAPLLCLRTRLGKKCSVEDKKPPHRVRKRNKNFIPCPYEIPALKIIKKRAATLMHIETTV